MGYGEQKRTFSRTTPLLVDQVTWGKNPTLTAIGPLQPVLCDHFLPFVLRPPSRASSSSLNSRTSLKSRYTEAKRI